MAKRGVLRLGLLIWALNFTLNWTVRADCSLNFLPLNSPVFVHLLLNDHRFQSVVGQVLREDASRGHVRGHLEKLEIFLRNPQAAHENILPSREYPAESYADYRARMSLLVSRLKVIADLAPVHEDFSTEYFDRVGDKVLGDWAGGTFRLGFPVFVTQTLRREIEYRIRHSLPDAEPVFGGQSFGGEMWSLRDLGMLPVLRPASLRILFLPSTHRFLLDRRGAILLDYLQRLHEALRQSLEAVRAEPQWLRTYAAGFAELFTDTQRALALIAQLPLTARERHQTREHLLGPLRQWQEFLRDESRAGVEPAPTNAPVMKALEGCLRS